ncbi:MAG: ABC transporter permease, partial [Candidatus Rokuibacteriota bacterium]
MTLSVGPFRRLAGYVKPHVPMMVLGAGLALVVSATEGAVAWLVKPAMDDVFIRRDMLMLKLIPLAFLVVYLIKGVTRYFQSYVMAAVGERVVARLRRDLYTHIQRMSLAFFSGVHSADLMSRIMNDINRLAHLSSNVLVMAVLQIGTLVSLTVVMFMREWVLTLLALTVFPLIALAVHLIGRRLYDINRRTQRQIAQLAVVLHESFAGTKIVKAFGREGFEQERFDGVNDRLLRLSLKNARADYIAEPLLELFAAVGIAGALWYGGYRVINGDMTPGTFFSFTAALVMLYGPARQLARALNKVQQTSASVERVFEILDLPPAIADAPDAVTLGTIRDRIRFEDVSFRYPDTEVFVLRDISLQIARGEVVAFVGMSGAG